MISGLISLVATGVACIGTIFVLAIALYFRAHRKPNEKQIHALRIMLPTDAERPAELHSVDLERLAVYIYQRLGYRNVKYTGVHSSTDGGVDVWMLSPSGHVEIVQCKQWKAKVGSSEIIEFAKVMRQQHAEIGHYWAPMGFSAPARRYAKKSNHIILYEDYEIRKLLEQVAKVDKVSATQKSITTPKVTTKKIWTVSQVTIIFGMILVACSLIYYLLATFATV
jgi:uncharacterized ubiquitin-like protein YukD